MLTHSHAGVSLVELMIGLAILSLLLVLGMPSFTIYLQNSKLRSAADTLYASMQEARAEAVRHNAQVEFVLTDDDPTIANVDTVTPSPTGHNWLLRLVVAPPAPDSRFIDGKSGNEGSGQAQGVTPWVTLNGGAVSSVIFNGLGNLFTPTTTATFTITPPDPSLCVANGGTLRCLNVVVSVGGTARMCDPAVTAVGDTRKC